MITTLVIVLLALMASAYAVCGVPFGYLVSKKSAGVDVTKVGSGNIGSTNVARTVGLKAGALTLFLDAAKGFVCVYLAKLLLALALTRGELAPFEPTGEFGWTIAMVFMAAVIGHIFSPYLHFKGGKGIACGFGACLALCWPLAIAILIVFLVFSIPTRYVSLGSLAASISLPIFAAIFYWPINWGFEVPLIFAAAAAVWAHRQNAKKLISGEERAFKVKDGKDDPMDHSDDSVRAVEEATMEAAEADAARPPKAGVGLSFGDEAQLKTKIGDAVDDIDVVNEEVDAFSKALEDGRDPMEALDALDDEDEDE